MSRLIQVTVPATSANMGPGFDCIGMAFKLYNHISVAERPQGLHITCQSRVPADETNLIYQTMRTFYAEAGIKMPGLSITQKDNIPLTGGLGSSAACIVGGLLAANALTGAGLSREALIEMAARIEGHPDNSTPAFTGGIVVGAMDGHALSYIKLTPPCLHELRFAVMIPDFQLATTKARSVLPQAVSMADAVFNASRTALMTAALMSGDFSKLATAMEDRLHQPYRLPLVPGMDTISQKAKDLGALSVYLSGAGSALIAVTEAKSVSTGFLSEMRLFLSTLTHKWAIEYVEPDLEGAVVSEYTDVHSFLPACSAR